MKYLAQAYLEGGYEDVTITDEDIKKYPKKYEPYTMYCPKDDITIIWAIEILVMPKYNVELKRTIIGFVYGSPDSKDDQYYIKRAFKDYQDKGKTNISLSFMLED